MTIIGEYNIMILEYLNKNLDELMLKTNISVQKEVIKLVFKGFEKRLRNLILD